jgi:hypothetical protein
VIFIESDQIQAKYVCSEEGVYDAYFILNKDLQILHKKTKRSSALIGAFTFEMGSQDHFDG